MDYTISNNAKLFDEVLKVLDRHRDEPGVGEAFEDLKAAKFNYVQRSTDHMVKCLVLGIHDLMVHSPSEALLGELRAVLHWFYMEMFQTGSRLCDLAREYEAGGGRALTHDEILEEVDQRRGASR